MGSRCGVDKLCQKCMLDIPIPGSSINLLPVFDVLVLESHNWLLPLYRSPRCGPRTATAIISSNISSRCRAPSIPGKSSCRQTPSCFDRPPRQLTARVDILPCVSNARSVRPYSAIGLFYPITGAERVCRHSVLRNPNVIPSALRPYYALIANRKIGSLRRRRL